ncbi:hypothetical protein CDAR_499391 [Caerostris darwini]|uniref:Uncharacterized protein n=1 Tax=Caerostris darwini TaxID=1538125 RepID=A0AAV4P305_9ARAC|nr:hypothetical protein CDAR_499391 [Caerostris darwini]
MFKAPIGTTSCNPSQSPSLSNPGTPSQESLGILLVKLSMAAAIWLHAILSVSGNSGLLDLSLPFTMILAFSLPGTSK